MHARLNRKDILSLNPELADPTDRPCMYPGYVNNYFLYLLTRMMIYLVHFCLFDKFTFEYIAKRTRPNVGKFNSHKLSNNLKMKWMCLIAVFDCSKIVKFECKASNKTVSNCFCNPTRNENKEQIVESTLVSNDFPAFSRFYKVFDELPAE